MGSSAAYPGSEPLPQSIQTVEQTLLKNDWVTVLLEPWKCKYPWEQWVSDYKVTLKSKLKSIGKFEKNDSEIKELFVEKCIDA